MRDWPDPACIDDLVSFRAFAAFIHEYIPSYHEYERHLRPYCKKGAKFKEYLADPEAVKAFEDLKQAVYEDAGNRLWSCGGMKWFYDGPAIATIARRK